MLQKSVGNSFNLIPFPNIILPADENVVAVAVADGPLEVAADAVAGIVREDSESDAIPVLLCVLRRDFYSLIPGAVIANDDFIRECSGSECCPAAPQ